MSKRIEYDGLTKRDLKNLDFLLSASKETIQDWINHTEEDDLEYALDLMYMHHLRICDIAAERSDLAEAKKVLAKLGIPTNKVFSKKQD